MGMDKLMEEFINPDRWEYELNLAVDKGINKNLCRKLSEPEFRAMVCLNVRRGHYRIAPPHMQKIPKDNGEFRTVYINEDLDRIILSLINNILFDLCPDWISYHCTSYQKGIGTGKVVRRVSEWIQEGKSDIVGCKTDLSKYFDSVPIREIDRIFDKLKDRFGESPIIETLQAYYYQDLCFDEQGNLIEHYQSLKQGCATASFFADVLLYEVDEQMARIGNYVRYSDDMLFICPQWKRQLRYLKKALGEMGLTLNPKKVEYIRKDRWVKFLGFSLKGDQISLSKNRLKSFQKEIQKRTAKGSPRKCLNSVNRYLYKGITKEGYCWATSVLSVINSEQDISELNKFVLDCLKASQTRNRKVGGLGYEHHSDGVITRGLGRNVKANRRKVDRIEGYLSIQCMRNALLINKEVYDTLVREL